MKMRYKILIALLVAIPVVAQLPTPTWVYAWTNGPTWFRLGPTLAVTNGQLDVALPAVPVRHFNLRLTYDTTRQGWPLPAGATDVVVRVNGLGYDSDDYTVTAGLLQPKAGNMDPSFKVVIDYTK